MSVYLKLKTCTSQLPAVEIKISFQMSTLAVKCPCLLVRVIAFI